MKSESIQARKLQLIIFSNNELITRAQSSAKQIKMGQVLSYKDVEKQSKNC